MKLLLAIAAALGVFALLRFLAGGADSFEALSSDVASGGGWMKYSADQIAAAIKQVETGGNYTAKGASTENGAYQFMPSTWAQWAARWLGDAAAPQTPANQDAVAKSQIQSWIDKGYTPQQIALLWNGGTTTAKSGVNKFGVAYDSGAYATKVLNALTHLFGA